MTEPRWDRFRWLIPGQLAGSPHPDLFGGLHALKPFIRNNGVRAIVTLGTEPLDPTPESVGLRGYFSHTENYRPPPDLPEILDFIDDCIDRDLPVVAHCFAGIGRTGTVLATWLLRHHPSMGADAAIERVRDTYIPRYARGRFPEDPSQEEAMRAFARMRS